MFSAAAILDVIADRASRRAVADQGDARPRRYGAAVPDGLTVLGAGLRSKDRLALLHLVIGARQRIGEIDRRHSLARLRRSIPCAPYCGDPERSMIATAVLNEGSGTSGTSAGLDATGAVCARPRTQGEVE